MKKRIIIRRHIRPGTVGSSTGRSPTIQAKPVDKEALNRFAPSILGLGDISSPAREIEAIAAMFDLAGFTKFCNQVDPHLAVPKFLSSFLDWLFERIKKGLTLDDTSAHTLWAELPFLAKFQGDGVLFLWNIRGMNEKLVCKIVTTLYEICIAYRQEFYPKIRMAVDKPPITLRCGVARGRVFSVGNGKDYVGHCINIASRLQKLSLLTFCFPHRGFNIREYMDANYRKNFVQKRITIRGIGENELMWVLKEEFEKLPEKSKELFKNI